MIGGIEAEQHESGRSFRNDRLIDVPVETRAYEAVHQLDDLPPRLIDEIEQFFVHYNRMRGRTFKALRRQRAAQALDVAKSALTQRA